MSSYTSVSLVSTSPWYGPGSCPIISPSRWSQQVLDNLCVLALHDHSASAGEGASSFSALTLVPAGQQEVISPYFPSGSTSWTVIRDLNYPGSFNVSTSTNGASIAYNVYLGTGIHNISVYFARGSSFGIVTGCLSGNSPIATPASFNGYKSGTEQAPTGSFATNGSYMQTFQFKVFTTAEFAASGSAVTGSLVGSGKYSFVLKVSGSTTGSSTGYIARLGYINID